MIRRWARDLRNEDLQTQPEVSPEEQQRQVEADYWRLNDLVLDEMESEPLPDDGIRRSER